MIPPTMMLSARAAARLEAFLEGKHYLLSTSMQGLLVALMALVAMLTSAPGPGAWVSYETLILIAIGGVVYAMIGTLLRTSTLRGGFPQIPLPQLPKPGPKPRTAAEFAGFDPAQSSTHDAPAPGSEKLN
jgi:hypothetical protein